MRFLALKMLKSTKEMPKDNIFDHIKVLECLQKYKIKIYIIIGCSNHFREKKTKIYRGAESANPPPPM